MELTKKKLDYKWVILASAFAMVFFCLGFCSGNKGMYLAAITEALGIKRSLFSINDSCRHIATAVINLFFGALVARYGIRKMVAFGFAAFGVHVKNYPPVIFGVVLFSALAPAYTVTTPGIQLATILVASLAPIAGEFGIAAGIAAGMLHGAIVMCTGEICGKLPIDRKKLFLTALGVGAAVFAVGCLLSYFLF